MRAVNVELAPQPDGNNQRSVFVHGLDTNFSEIVTRDVALVFDTGRPVEHIMYPWPSA